MEAWPGSAEHLPVLPEEVLRICVAPGHRHVPRDQRQVTNDLTELVSPSVAQSQRLHSLAVSWSHLVILHFFLAEGVVESTSNLASRAMEP